uniref:Fe2OG dioxygenase domain-containing protein n=1 Tax=Chromera velia CCMP2878 TaxID=1169474 RepID=A0A0G4HPM5_9ALVE|eukprot:Cvel_7806.t1-p1 / transcript=Cvel_7806.t1 / gene=Cvel_7806 / organism=Chromera_velia_CCMP2878 / gene_product=hypothetical protein / transcript_product=hypothetical protein / location=Cvel_scaffold416:80629-83145(-) / protein_length=260 / sequence_SO=supercontig / SO=protein_coding / is_pseudo=false
MTDESSAFETGGSFALQGTEVEVRLCSEPVPGNPFFENAQDHIPLAYAHVRGFLNEEEVLAISDFFSKKEDPSIRVTEFTGEDVEEEGSGDGDGTGKAKPRPGEGQPLVHQLYGNPEPFMKKFPQVFERVTFVLQNIGKLIGLSEEETKDVTWAQDIRHITYRPGQTCTWHRDDPTSHFNTIFLLSQPGADGDFEGGPFMLHPSRDPTVVPLQRGDAVVYSVPRMDHAVGKVTRGTRQICLVEMKRPQFKNKTKEEPPSS